MAKKQIWVMLFWGLVLWSAPLLFARPSLFSVVKTDVSNSLDLGINLVQSFSTPSPSFAWKLMGLGLLLSADEVVNTIFRRNQTAFNDNLFAIDRWHGNVKVLVPTAFVLYATGLITGHAKVRLLGLKSTQAMFYSGLVVVTLKELFGRARPFQNKGAFRFKPFAFQDRWRAFPSGHAALSFAFSTIMASAKANVFWKIFWYSSATLVATARMYHNKHWLSDVIAGSFIGWSVARITWKHTPNSNNEQALRVAPFFLPKASGAFGLTFSLNLN